MIIATTDIKQSNMPHPVPQIEVKIYDQKQLVFSTQFHGRLEIGRQQPGEPRPFHLSNTDSLNRVIIADQEDNTISRRQAAFERLEDGRLNIMNLSSAMTLGLSDGTSIEPGGSMQTSLPSVVQIGSKVVRLLAAANDNESDGHIERLATPTMLPGQMKVEPQLFSSLALPTAMNQRQDVVLDWLQAMMSVFQSAASSERFIADAAAAVANMTHLDCAAVLRLFENQWKITAFYSPEETVNQASWQPSATILNEILNGKTTIRQLPSTTAQPIHSLATVNSLVASPILDQAGNVIGALYGDRRTSIGLTGVAISELEARLVDLLACGVSTGLARLEQEKAAVAARVQFEQFFTPELTRQLELDPDLLRGRDAAVTLLFCDIRKFSHYSEKLGPQGTFEWINDVMEILSECVIAHEGVLVDYIGDELMAMWGAPALCESQATLACRAAIDAVQQLSELNRRWQSRLGGEMDIGIGINTGMARVGNTGSPRKFKYGPLGNTVNLASRVQSATKQLGVQFMVTGSTVAKLDATFQVRRLCRVRVFNIAEPTDLFEVADSQNSPWIQHKESYAAALEAFESDDCMTAIHLAGSLVKHLPNDGPTLLLLSRAIERARNQDLPFDPVWTLDRK